MGIKGTFWKWIGHATGNHIFRSLPHGIDVFQDIEKYLPEQRIETIFDVGANVGQSALTYIKKFPTARILSFEPVPESFAQLQRSVARHPLVRCFPLGLAAEAGSGRMLVSGTSSENRLVSEAKPAFDEQDRVSTSVELQTLDGFCDTEAIRTIHYLKIDTEGGDLDVLRGAEGLLIRQDVDLVEVEAGMNPRNTHHVPFEALKEHLEKRRYYLFGIYQQRREIFTDEPHLRRTNPVFVSQRVIDSNRGRRRARRRG